MITPLSISRASAPAESEVPKELLFIPDLFVLPSHVCTVTWGCSVVVPPEGPLLPHQTTPFISHGPKILAGFPGERGEQS